MSLHLQAWKRGESGFDGSGMDPSTKPKLFLAESALVIELCWIILC